MSIREHKNAKRKRMHRVKKKAKKPRRPHRKQEIKWKRLIRTGYLPPDALERKEEFADENGNPVPCVDKPKASWDSYSEGSSFDEDDVMEDVIMAKTKQTVLGGRGGINVIPEATPDGLEDQFATEVKTLSSKLKINPETPWEDVLGIYNSDEDDDDRNALTSSDGDERRSEKSVTNAIRLGDEESESDDWSRDEDDSLRYLDLEEEGYTRVLKRRKYATGGYYAKGPYYEPDPNVRVVRVPKKNFRARATSLGDLQRNEREKMYQSQKAKDEMEEISDFLNGEAF